MAKLTGPLMSLGASGAIAKTLVYFPWKGLNVARQHVVPANPQSAAQVAQRAMMTAAVLHIHNAQIDAVAPLIAIDVSAYALLGSTRSTPRTWFNEAVKNFVDQQVAGIHGAIYHGMVVTPGAGELALDVNWLKDSGSANDVTAGNFYYGVSKSALINVEAAAVAANHLTATLTGLTAGTRYFFQFRATAHADFIGTVSGIYSGVPT